jgi:uncharacterized protein with HEPN domain
MKRRDDELRLRHMLDHAREAVALLEGKRRSHLDRERLLELALVRLVEIVGEAAARVSTETCGAASSIPWPHVIGMRHRLVHGYDAVDLDILWATVREDLPALITELEKILKGGSAVGS